MGYWYTCPNCGLRDRQCKESLEHMISHQEPGLLSDTYGMTGPLTDFNDYMKKLERAEVLMTYQPEVQGCSPVIGREGMALSYGILSDESLRIENESETCHGSIEI